MSATAESVTNEGDLHKYFTLMLNLADDQLDPFQYRLLAHYVRKAGQGGILVEGLRTSAKKCRMSVAKARAARNELIEQGYLAVTEPTLEQVKEGVGAEIRVLDRWAENVSHYANPESKMTRGTRVKSDAGTRVKNDTAPVSNLTRLEEQKKEPQKEQGIASAVADAAPAKIVPFPGEGHAPTTGDMIGAYWNALPTKPASIDPARVYKNKTHHGYARNLLEAGADPFEVACFVRAKTAPGGYYHERPLFFKNVADELPSWRVSKASEIALARRLAASTPALPETPPAPAEDGPMVDAAQVEALMADLSAAVARRSA